MFDWPAAQVRAREPLAVRGQYIWDKIKDEQAEGGTMRTTIAIRSLLFSFVLLAFSHGAFAQISIGVSVNFGPPPLPVYEQPICPGDGYLWTPGYWAYDDDDGYYWVPGTWVEAPQVGFLWTPGYWGWGGNAFFFHEGYWDPRWASTAASTMALATGALVMRAAAGKAITSPTIVT
jgi:WXXGXW repeat (2 copies)